MTMPGQAYRLTAENEVRKARRRFEGGVAVIL